MLSLTGCTNDAEANAQPGEPAALDGDNEGDIAGQENGNPTLPTPVLQLEGAELSLEWEEYEQVASPLETFEPARVPGLEFWDDAWALPDGRYLVLGRWDGDAPLALWKQHNPDSIAPGEDLPERSDFEVRPVRLFLVNPDTAEITPMSHEPEIREYSTAVFIGASAEVIVDVVLLSDGETVAYSSSLGAPSYYQVDQIFHVEIPAI